MTKKSTEWNEEQKGFARAWSKQTSQGALQDERTPQG